MRTSAVGAVLSGVLASLPSPAWAQEVATPAPAAAVAPAPAEEKKDFDPGKYVAGALENLGIPIRLNGYAWVDTGYLSRTYDLTAYPQQDAAYMQGRVVLGAGLKRTFGDYYGEVKVQFLGLVNEYAKSQYEPDTLEAYLQIGHQKWWDLQIGRFLAWEVYHRGQGIELYTLEDRGVGYATLYWLDYTRGYLDQAGQVAVHFYPWSFLKFELAGVYGQQDSQNNFGVRPVVDFSLGDFQLIGGYELLLKRPQTASDKVEKTQMGFAAKAQYRFPVVTVGADVAWSSQRVLDINATPDTGNSWDKASFGGFVDLDFWNNSIGLGYHRTNQTDQRSNFVYQDQAFVSYLYRLPIKGLDLKAVYYFGHGHKMDNGVGGRKEWDDYLQSFRLRISYAFE